MTDQPVIGQENKELLNSPAGNPPIRSKAIPIKFMVIRYNQSKRLAFCGANYTAFPPAWQR
jgi:hypothetical protein